MLSVKVGKIPQCLGIERAVIWLPLFLHKVTLGGERGEEGKGEGRGSEGKGKKRSDGYMNERERVAIG